VTPIVVILSHNDPINKGETERLKQSHHGRSWISLFVVKKKKTNLFLFSYYDVKSLTYIFWTKNLWYTRPSFAASGDWY